MNPRCARCSKTVYPVEKLNCLDKTWHKGCFNCEVCQLKLTMKTYKGYNKLPYCNTHYPTTKFTAVADTPENLRLKGQTDNQSQVKYQSGFKENLKQFHSVANEPEMERARMVQKQASGTAYTASHRAEAAAVDEQRSQPSYQPQHQQHHQQPQPVVPMPSQAPVPAAAAPPPVAKSNVKRWRALYDYSAADEDEAGFNEGDFILNVDVIDEGWISGTVERTGQSGMMPRNYFEEV
ncbi:LIM and SH3 domain protein 1-like [Sycon ciliatum]|uniref:LIM and SH3 domain protein 1-like n=1 Tax=Sycon ciliatum TaxID=27933 RepID=UPI0020A9996B|eukprot:scpid67324/ scgid14658/ LIM zinc-binding domain-containing Nebulette; Actin-binding Z-disk protein